MDKRFKATRIKIDGITFDLDSPINNRVEYNRISRQNRDKAVESLVKKGYIKIDKEIKRQKTKEDAIIRTLKRIGGVFVP